MNTQPVLPQMTVKAVTLAMILAVLLAAANAYLGLFAGMTVAASIPAAVVSMAILRMFAESNILENNIVQTGASAGVSIASGTIFTIPALVLLGYWTEFEYWWVVAIAGLGGLLGVLFSVPLRRTLIVEQKLIFPEGTATAEVLKVGERPKEGLKLLGFAALAGGLVKIAESGLRFSAETFQAATYVGKGTIAYFGSNLSPALLGVGYIVGLNIAMLVFAGGVISWWIAIPIYGTFFAADDPALASQIGTLAAADAAYEIWSQQIRYLGVGAMLVGGIWALVSLRSSLLSGIKSGLNLHLADSGPVPHTEQDLPMKFILIGILLFVIPIFMLYQAVVDDLTVSLPMAVIMVITGFLFSSVSGYMAGLVGSSNNPVSGITIATILFAALVLLWLMGPNAAIGAVAAIMIGAVVCNAAAIAGDNLQDLKCGYIVGATPWRQQVMLAIGAVCSAAVMAPVLNLLLKAYGIGVPTEDHPNPLIAPQATLMASVAKGIFGGGLPWGMIGIGGGIGAAIIALDEFLKTKGTRWRTPVLAVAVGIYLPLELSTPILLGGLVAEFAARRQAQMGPDDQLRLKRSGMLFAAGLITGEALIGILMAIPIVATSDRDVLALPQMLQLGGWPGLIAVLALAFFMYRLGSRRPEAAQP